LDADTLTKAENTSIPFNRRKPAAKRGKAFQRVLPSGSTSTGWELRRVVSLSCGGYFISEGASGGRVKGKATKCLDFELGKRSASLVSS